MAFLSCALLGYLMGSFSPAYFLSMIKGFDIRERGSKNAGATNVFLLMGKARGAVCMIIDICKAYFSVKLARLLFPWFAPAFAVTATACVVGHSFPFYMGFRGGKGTACLGGILLAYNFRLAMVFLAAEVLIALLTQYLCAVPITASIGFCLVYGLRERELLGCLILAVLAGVVFFRHLENLDRIRQGTEVRIRFLWEPGEELERVKEGFSEEEIQLHRDPAFKSLNEKELKQ